jgi:GTPase SAR1 family protein
MQLLEGHQAPVTSVAWSPDGTMLASQDSEGEVIVWDTSTSSICVRKSPPSFRWAGSGVVFVTSDLSETFGRSLLLTQVDLTQAPIATRRYRSAKIVLLGESEVGKSTLALRLAEDRYEPQSTTHGMKVWTLASHALNISDTSPLGEEREVFLWDLGGQGEYQLIHQLFLHDTRLALFLMDPTRNKDNFAEVADWNVRLEAQLQRRGTTASKLLLQSKADLPQTRPVDPVKLEALMRACSFGAFLRVSAAQPQAGDTITELRERLSNYINWDEVPPVTTLKTTRDIYDAVMSRRRAADIFVTIKALRAQFPGIELRDLEYAVRLLAEQGLVVEIDDLGGERVLLLRVEEIERYAGAIILAVHANPRGVPAVEENTIFAESALPGIDQPLPLHERHLLITSVIQLLVEKGICFRKYGQLIFPTEFPREKPPVVGEFDDPVTVRFDFSGAVRNLYAAVVSRLHHVGRFGQISLWRNWSQFERESEICALELSEPVGGQSHFTVFSNRTCSVERKKDFTEFVREFLLAEGADPRLGYALRCSCGAVYPESIVEIAIAHGETTFRCGACSTRHDLRQPLDDQRGWGQLDGEQVSTIIASPITATPKGGQTGFGILHLSDLHFKDGDSLEAVLGPLREDLTTFHHSDVEFVVISGDLTDRGGSAGFELAADFIRRLHDVTGVPLGRFIVCPGNHDVQNLDSIFALKTKVTPGEEIVEKFADDAYRVRISSEYPRRFERFCLRYNELFDYDLRTGLPELSREQLFPEQRTQFVTLNSAVRIDKYRPKDATIDPAAFAKTLEQADKTMASVKMNGPALRIVVWHHAVLGPWSIPDASPFVQRLAQGRYALLLHGDVHETRAQIADPFERAIRVVGAGSLHAPDSALPVRTGNLYNLIEVDREFKWIKIHVREQRVPNGAFAGRYAYGEDDAKVDYFTIERPPLYI